MTSKFAGIVKILDLDDYILPSQECIKPPPPILKNEVKIQSIKVKDGKYTQINDAGEHRILEKAKITLNDCLACSGCVTSAETVLIAQQSIDELEKVALHNKSCQCGNSFRPIVVSCSLQSLSSLAAYYGIENIEKAALCLKSFFQKIFGIQHFFNSAYARNFSLIESGKEFVDVWKNQHLKEQGDTRINSSKITNLKLPLITSVCPGWVCYAEKSLGPYIIPHMSCVKSPQQVMGSLIRNNLIFKPFTQNENQNLTDPNTIYHVSIMPCYDKKLEASRNDFKHMLTTFDETNESISDVDCVISTIEIQEYLKSHNLDLKQFFTGTQLESLNGYSDNLSRASNSSEISPSNFSFSHPGDGSGGYTEYVLNYAASALFGCENYKIYNKIGETDDVLVNQNYDSSDKYRLEITLLRNKDFREFKLIENATNECKLTFAQCYGFKNIQNVVQKLKKGIGKIPYAYIEIMACPSGCLNGGGQIKAQDFVQNSSTLNFGNDPINPKIPNQTLNISKLEREKIWQSIDAMYRTIPYVVDDPFKLPSINETYNQIQTNDESLFQTQYHTVPKDALLTSMKIKW